MSVKREWCIAKNARSTKSNFLWNVCVHAYVSHLKSTGHVWWLNHPVIIQMMTTVSNYFYTALIIIWFHFFRNRVLFYLLSVSVSLNLISKKYKSETYVLFLKQNISWDRFRFSKKNSYKCCLHFRNTQLFRTLSGCYLFSLFFSLHID